MHWQGWNCFGFGYRGWGPEFETTFRPACIVPREVRPRSNMGLSRLKPVSKRESVRSPAAAQIRQSDSSTAYPRQRTEQDTIQSRQPIVASGHNRRSPGRVRVNKWGKLGSLGHLRNRGLRSTRIHDGRDQPEMDAHTVIYFYLETKDYFNETVALIKLKSRSDGACNSISQSTTSRPFPKNITRDLHPDSSGNSRPQGKKPRGGHWEMEAESLS